MRQFYYVLMRIYIFRAKVPAVPKLRILSNDLSHKSLGQCNGDFGILMKGPWSNLGVEELELRVINC